MPVYAADGLDVPLPAEEGTWLAVGRPHLVGPAGRALLHHILTLSVGLLWTANQVHVEALCREGGERERERETANEP